VEPAWSARAATTWRWDDLAAQVDRRTRLLLVSQVSYLTGQRLDLALCAELAHGAARGSRWTPRTRRVVPVPGALCDFSGSSCYKWLLATPGRALRLQRAGWVSFRPATVGWHSVGHRGGLDDRSRCRGGRTPRRSRRATRPARPGRARQRARAARAARAVDVWNATRRPSGRAIGGAATRCRARARAGQYARARRGRARAKLRLRVLVWAGKGGSGSRPRARRPDDGTLLRRAGRVAARPALDVRRRASRRSGRRSPSHSADSRGGSPAHAGARTIHPRGGTEWTPAVLSNDLAAPWSERRRPCGGARTPPAASTRHPLAAGVVVTAEHTVGPRRTSPVTMADGRSLPAVARGATRNRPGRAPVADADRRRRVRRRRLAAGRPTWCWRLATAPARAGADQRLGPSGEAGGAETSTASAARPGSLSRLLRGAVDAAGRWLA